MKLFLFNPDNDLSLANGDVNFIPPRSARIMASDLSALPMWWANEGDAVCVSSIPEADTVRKMWQDRLPKLHWWTEHSDYMVDEVCPWGWNPMLRHKLLRSGLPSDVLLSDEQMVTYRVLSGRQTAVRLLSDFNRWASDNPEVESGLWCGTSVLCCTEAEAKDAVECHPQTMLKAPWSGSGKGLRFGRGEWVSPLSGWGCNVLREQGALVVEPFYNKAADLALELHSDGRGTVVYSGLSLFTTSVQGAYQGNVVAKEPVKEARLFEFIPEPFFRMVQRYLVDWLTAEVGSSYSGFLGVDMMVCHSEDSSTGYALHPCVEINLRMTMGMVSVLLGHYLAPDSEAIFSVDFFSDTKVLHEEHERCMNTHPVESVDGQWKKGYVWLTPIGCDTHYRASLQVEEGCVCSQSWGS